MAPERRCVVENRRRLNRRPAGWSASYRLAGEHAAEWRDCRVVDISMLGLGITFDHPDPAELAGRLVSVNLPGDGGCVNVRLEGQIKNASPTMSRDIRVGIEFIRLSETEQAITAVLSVMSDVLVATWRSAVHPIDNSNTILSPVERQGKEGSHGIPATSASKADGLDRLLPH
jgi:PilZ domain